MSKARLVITAVELEGHKVAEVAQAYGLSRSWMSSWPGTAPKATPRSSHDHAD
jgi:transposase